MTNKLKRCFSPLLSPILLDVNIAFECDIGQPDALVKILIRLDLYWWLKTGSAGNSNHVIRAHAIATHADRTGQLAVLVKRYAASKQSHAVTQWIQNLILLQPVEIGWQNRIDYVQRPWLNRQAVAGLAFSRRIIGPGQKTDCSG